MSPKNCKDCKVFFMGRLPAMAVFATTVFAMTAACFSIASAQQQSATPQPSANSKAAAAERSIIPPPPTGKPTVIGGIIHSVDPVRDQLSLKVFGSGKPMKMLFDVRTQVYRDGKKVSLDSLRPEERASVETVLDGTDIYALSVHMLSQSPEGNAEGQILDYNASSGQLILSGRMSGQQIKIQVPAGIPIVRQGQTGFVAAPSGPSDLVRGTLISVNFKSGSHDRAVATHIAIYATPGSQFIFSGNITALDLHSGLLVILDPTDDKTYQVSFDPVVLPARNLHEGERVTVHANFDGTRYMATSINGS